MNRAHFLLPILFLALLSCRNDDKRQVLASSGRTNHISIIIDDILWNGEIGDSIRNKFASPITGLPQEEPLFTINQYPGKLLEGYMTNSRNIIVIKQEDKSQYKIVRDRFAVPQNIIYISGRTVADILALLEKNSPEMIRVVHDIEIAETQKAIDTAKLDGKPIASQFNISLRIPSSYKPVMEKENFLWLKKEIISGNTSLLIYSVPVKCLQKNSNAIDNIIKMRDSIGSLYIHGTTPNSKMITEQAFAPYLSHVMLAGLKTYETKGTWEIKDDFMSGPFINYAIVDKKNHRILVLEGFCYAPSKPKRDLMHELEAIIETLEIPSP
jgi:hypothetical protein